MPQASQRNPKIKLYGLPWAFPAWVGGSTGNPYAYPNLTADYVTKWVQGAKSVYNLTVDDVVRSCNPVMIIHVSCE
jgi:galactosylceramidase